MPKIFEVFGRRLAVDSHQADVCKRSSTCPFREARCDGGGNRYLSHVQLSGKPDLQRFFGRHTSVPSAVCSLQLQPAQSPWIVCPRRLLTFPPNPHQSNVIGFLIGQSGYPTGTRLGVWAEVKIGYKNAGKSFDYTFDYILMPIANVSAYQASVLSDLGWPELRTALAKGKYFVHTVEDQATIQDFPIGPPLVVEIMTSSTSGGDKKKRTAIPMAFEDAILGRPHNAPGINYRQVWARMVSQLIVKSEVGMAWGGKTFWILQDVLIDYISTTTALDIRKFKSDHTSEVNILGFSYGEEYNNSMDVIRLGNSVLYAGPVSVNPHNSKEPAFEDMIRAAVCPPLSVLISRLANRPTVAKFHVNRY